MKGKASVRVKGLKPSAIRRMLECSKGMDNLVHFEQGEPDFTTPQHIIKAAEDALEKGFTHYTDVDGTLELRRAIKEKLVRENRINVDEAFEVTVTSGSQEAMLIASMGFLNRGDEALILEPYYPAYFEDTLIAEAVPVLVPYDERHGYSVDKEALEGSITDRTKMIWMSNPCNPTGHVFSRSDLMNIAEVARDHDLIVFSDEIYEKLVYDGAEHISIGSLPGMEERTITVNGFSKAYAMTGWRIGYIAAERKLSAVLRKLHYYAALCPNAISQKGAVAALTGSQYCVEKMLGEYGERRRLMLEGLSRNKSARYSVPNGAFYVFPDFSSFEKSDDDLSMLLLRQAGVVSVPGSGFGKAGQGHIRLSYSISRELIKEGIERINRFMESH